VVAVPALGPAAAGSEHLPAVESWPEAAELVLRVSALHPEHSEVAVLQQEAAVWVLVVSELHPDR